MAINLEPDPRQRSATSMPPVGYLKLLRALNFDGVDLEAGVHRDQQAAACEVFLAIPTDSLLWPFRVRKGLPAPGVPLRGWYGEGMFNNIGQFMTAYARLYAATGRRELAEKADELFRGWVVTLDEDGYFLNSMAANTREYSFDKLVCGLLDIHEYLGIDGALPALRKVTEWMARNGDTSRPYAWSGFGPLEWYTLPEYLLRAYTITNDSIYRDLAERYTYDEFYSAVLSHDVNELMRRADDAHNFYQAHSHVNTLNSAAAIYEASGDPRYLDVAIAGHDFTLQTQAFATGMFGPLEAFAKPRQLVEVLHSEVGHAEISCPSWALMRLARHLIELTGSARYGDWMELNIYNGIGAAPTTSRDGRATQYFANYGFANARKTFGLEWTCCSTTNAISVAEYSNQIYYQGEDALFVCLYLPSTVTAPFGGTTLTLTQRTEFPVDDLVHLEIDLASTNAAGRIGFRLPAWLSSAPSVSVNGEPISFTAEGGWAILDRVWWTGDVIEIALQREVQLIPIDTPDGPAAFRWGPVVLVAPNVVDRPLLKPTDLPALAQNIRRLKGQDIAFETRGPDGVALRLVPYFAVDPEVPYAMYFGDDDARRFDHSELEYSSDVRWTAIDAEEYLLTERRTFHLADERGASFEVEFEGTGVVWTGYRTPHAGYADVYLDGRFVERVSQLGRGHLQASCWSREHLAPGSHNLRVVVSGEAPARSRGTEVNVKHVRVIG